MYTVILAANSREANEYAKRAKLPRGRFRFATKAGTIRGLRVAEIHELPSFKGRLDRHAIEAELRYTRGTRLEVEMPPAEEAPAVDQGDGMGEQLDIFDVIDRGLPETTKRKPAPEAQKAQKAKPKPKAKKPAPDAGSFF